MSEMAFFKGRNIRCGWSALAGHAQSAYVYGGLDTQDSIVGHSSPSGSSSGSAIVTSAGFSPFALGTETAGSLVNPATRASLYTVKPNRGIVSNEGIMPISCVYDTAGPLAKSAEDVANLLTLLVEPSKTRIPKGGYAAALGGAWSELSVATLDPEKWKSPASVIKPVAEATEQIVEDTSDAYAKIKGLAKSYHDNIFDAFEKDFELDGQNALEARLAYGLEKDLGNYFSQLESSQVCSLRELADWNSEHSEEALTPEYSNQELLVAGVEADHSPDRLQKLDAHLQATGDRFEALFKAYDVDVIIAAGDSELYKYSAVGGFPLATLPLGYLKFNGRPFGLTITAPRHCEATLIKAMSAWEATFPARQPPKAFLEAGVGGVIP